MSLRSLLGLGLDGSTSNDVLRSMPSLVTKKLKFCNVGIKNQPMLERPGEGGAFDIPQEIDVCLSGVSFV
jgi:hypothetical protein